MRATYPYYNSRSIEKTFLALLNYLKYKRMWLLESKNMYMKRLASSKIFFFKYHNKKNIILETNIVREKT